jgi:pimeloyl-ACP methyl ester carboxylesterase
MHPGFDGLSRVAIAGDALAYREAGSGTPVVLVHGSASDIRTWDGVFARLAEEFRVVAYSRRYARPNVDIAPGVDDRMDVHVEDLVAVQQNLGARPAHLVGHSWGGFVALLTAMRHPDCVASMVLIEPPVLSLVASTPPRPAELLRVLGAEPALALAILKFGLGAVLPAQRAHRRGDAEAAMRAFGRGVLGPAAFAGLSESRVQQVRDNQATDRAQIMGAGFPPLPHDEVRKVSVPVLILTGRESPALWRRLGSRLAALLPDAKVRVIADASHVIHEDAPDQFVNAVVSHIRGQAASGLLTN